MSEPVAAGAGAIFTQRGAVMSRLAISVLNVLADTLTHSIPSSIVPYLASTILSEEWQQGIKVHLSRGDGCIVRT